MLVAVQREGCGASDRAAAVGYQGGELGWSRNVLLTHLVCWHRPIRHGRNVEPTAKRQRGVGSNDGGGSSADEESSSGNEDSSN
jgi:hypothetical protein